MHQNSDQATATFVYTGIKINSNKSAAKNVPVLPWAECRQVFETMKRDREEEEKKY